MTPETAKPTGRRRAAHLHCCGRLRQWVGHKRQSAYQSRCGISSLVVCIYLSFSMQGGGMSANRVSHPAVKSRLASSLFWRRFFGKRAVSGCFLILLLSFSSTKNEFFGMKIVDLNQYAKQWVVTPKKIAHAPFRHQGLSPSLVVMTSEQFFCYF